MMHKQAVLERYYLDCRCMLLELAATMDRYDRAPATPGDSNTDARLTFLRQATQILIEPAALPNRSQRILQLMSDPVE
jgi:hypothetical protein